MGGYGQKSRAPHTYSGGTGETQTKDSRWGGLNGWTERMVQVINTVYGSVTGSGNITVQ